MTTDAYPVSIFIAGDPAVARQVCREFCLTGLCVTLTETDYIFTGGQERGVIVGLINYPRFPKEPEDIEDSAEMLGSLLAERLCQRSYTIQTPTETVYYERDLSIPR